MATPTPGKPVTRGKRSGAQRAATSDARGRILEVAKGLFAAKGYAGVSMREIAAASQLTLPTLYHHFGDKRGLFLACRGAVLGDAAAQVRAALEGREARDRAVSATVALCSLLFSNPTLLVFVQFELHHRAHRSRPDSGRWEVLPDLTAAIKEAYPGARSLAGLSAAESLVAMIVGHALVHRAQSPRAPAVDAAQFAHHALEMMTAR